MSVVTRWVLERGTDIEASVTATNYTLSRLCTGSSFAFCSSLLQVDSHSLLLSTSRLFIMQSPQSSKRKCLSFETKIKIIEEVEKGDKSKTQTCRENNIVSCTLSTFLKDKDKVRETVEQGATKHK